MHPDSLLSELGTLAGVGPLRLNDQGCAAVVFDQSITVNFEWNETSAQFLMYTVLGRVPADAGAGFFRSLLEANLFGAETRGAVLAIDGLENEILLHRTIAIESTSPAHFQTEVGQFVDAVEAWMEKLARLDTPDAGVSDDDDSVGAGRAELLRI